MQEEIFELSEFLFSHFLPIAINSQNPTTLARVLFTNYFDTLMSSNSLETEFKISTLFCETKQKKKLFPRGADYLTLLLGALKEKPNSSSNIEYPSYSAISAVSPKEREIQVPIINGKCLNANDPCVFDLYHFIAYIKTQSNTAKSIKDKIRCPKCGLLRDLNEYSIDLGFEFILKDFMRKPVVRFGEQLKIESRQSIPKGYFVIHRDGTYIFLEGNKSNRKPEIMMEKIIETAFANRILKALSDSGNPDTLDLLKVKKSQLWLEEKKIRMQRTIPDFCVFKALSCKKDVQRFTDSGTEFDRVWIWFPQHKSEAFLKDQMTENLKEMTVARPFELCSENQFEKLSFNSFSYIIKIPEVGFWITGGAEQPPDCYEVSLGDAWIEDNGFARCTPLPKLPTSLFKHAGICVKDYVYICGGTRRLGSTSEMALTETWRMNWKNPTKWEKCGNMKHGRLCHALFAQKDRIYCLAGKVKTVEYYDINFDVWEELKLKVNALAPHAYMCAQRLGNSNKVLIMGGINHEYGTRESETYVLDLQNASLDNVGKQWKLLPGVYSDFPDLNSVYNGKVYFLGPYVSKNYHFAASTYSVTETLELENQKVSFKLPL